MMVPPPVAEAEAARSEPDYFVRFSIGQRIEHAVLAATFVALSATGLAEKYYTAAWAQWLILALGGIEYTRLVHRIFGALFTISALYHFAFLANHLVVRHGRPTMLPSLKDARDVVDTLRYTFGLTDRIPQPGRYDYRQKFEYWGIVFGGTVMIATGFMLAYPLVVTRLLPGQLVAAAREAHGSEAMLAVMTIVIWHLYEVIFRPGIFPADTSIFTGRISRKRMLEEHPVEYAEVSVVKTETGPPPETPADPAPG